MLLLITLLLFVTLILQSQCAEIPCNQQSIDKLDDNVLKLTTFGDPNRNLPNEKDVMAHCQADSVMISWGKNYTKTCLINRKEEMSHHVTNLLMFSMKKVMNKRCRSETSRAVFIKAGKCANSLKDDTIKCWNKYIIDTQQVNKAKGTIIKNDKHLLPLICCAYHRFHDCSVDAWSKSNGAEPCNSKSVRELEGYVNDSMYDIIQYLCGDYQENSDRCDNLINRYKEVFTTVRINKIAKSPLSASNEIFNFLPPV
ncbi:uncharacterized protein LOC128959716 [Oppia nitens]|uniref:uncharacterized protein LOC128959716 n=1 Tax=Oppia nitens TaxID=1686743 RepID=UPI0023DC5D7A|nr:uncharacterized protein LOC128959716 [Oppia nitens]